MNILNDNFDLNKILGDAVIDLIKDKIELFLKEELEAYLKEYLPDGSKNGYYSRNLETKFGVVNDLQVPRDRQGEYQTELFEPYSRRDAFLEESIIALYQSGVSTRKVAEYVEKLIGKKYSAGTISNVSNVVLEDIQKWQNRSLDGTFLALYLDGIHIKFKREDVATEAVYVALGLRFDGSREVLGFYVGGRETAEGWRDILLNLKQRGLKYVDLGIFDGLPGLEEAFRSVFPLANVQRCVVHKMRNLMNKVRVKDKAEVGEDFRAIYSAESKDRAIIAFEKCKENWEHKYKREIQSWENDLDVLLTFYRYPAPIRRFIYTTNLIERLNKEIRKRIKTMNSLPNIEAAEKIIYLQINEYNVKRKVVGTLAGFSSCQKELEEIKTRLESHF